MPILAHIRHKALYRVLLVDLGLHREFSFVVEKVDKKKYNKIVWKTFKAGKTEQSLQ